MKKFRVTLIVDCTISFDVEAEDAEKAKEKAIREAYVPSLCHHCSNDFEMGDVIDTGEASEV